MEGSSVLRAREQLDPDEDNGEGPGREDDKPFQQRHPALFELLKQTQDKIKEIDRDTTAQDVQELELASRADLDVRVRHEQSLAIKLAKEGGERDVVLCCVDFLFSDCYLRVQSTSSCSVPMCSRSCKNDKMCYFTSRFCECFRGRFRRT